jgi:hypothetical protein
VSNNFDERLTATLLLLTASPAHVSTGHAENT